MKLNFFIITGLIILSSLAIAKKPVVCGITINSNDEINYFKSRKDLYDVVELYSSVDEKSFVSDRQSSDNIVKTICENAERSGKVCDMLVLSSHGSVDNEGQTYWRTEGDHDGSSNVLNSLDLIRASCDKGCKKNVFSAKMNHYSACRTGVCSMDGNLGASAPKSGMSPGASILLSHPDSLVCDDKNNLISSTNIGANGVGASGSAIVNGYKNFFRKQSLTNAFSDFDAINNSEKVVSCMIDFRNSLPASSKNDKVAIVGNDINIKCNKIKRTRDIMCTLLQFDNNGVSYGNDYNRFKNELSIKVKNLHNSVSSFQDILTLMPAIKYALINGKLSPYDLQNIFKNFKKPPLQVDGAITSFGKTLLGYFPSISMDRFDSEGVSRDQFNKNIGGDLIDIKIFSYMGLMPSSSDLNKIRKLNFTTVDGGTGEYEKVIFLKNYSYIEKYAKMSNDNSQMSIVKKVKFSSGYTRNVLCTGSLEDPYSDCQNPLNIKTYRPIKKVSSHPENKTNKDVGIKNKSKNNESMLWIDPKAKPQTPEYKQYKPWLSFP